MSASILSPLDSELSSLFDSLSPPPTPIAKRAHRFFPGNAATPPPVPMFFPKSQSVIGSSPKSSRKPPLTPIARRAHHFFPSNAATPTSSMLFSTNQCQHSKASPSNKETTENKQLVALSSRPVPTIRLKPRSTRIPQPRDGGKPMELDRIPPLPYSIPEKSFKPIESIMPTKLPPRAGSKNVVKSTLKKPEPIAYPNQHVKLPAFQRGGMKHRTFRKQNSFVARSA